MSFKKLGEILKEAIEKSPFSVAEVAESIGTTPQNLYKLFKKESVDTKYLNDISKVIGVPVGSFFTDMFALPDETNKSENNLLTQLKKENLQLKKRIGEIETMNSLLISKLPYALLGEVLMYLFIEYEPGSDKEKISVPSRYIKKEEMKEMIDNFEYPDNVKKMLLVKLYGNEKWE